MFLANTLTVKVKNIVAVMAVNAFTTRKEAKKKKHKEDKDLKIKKCVCHLVFRMCSMVNKLSVWRVAGRIFTGIGGCSTALWIGN